MTLVGNVVASADRWSSASGQEKDLALAAGSAVFELSLTFSVGGMLLLFGTTVWIAWLGLMMWRRSQAANAG